MWVIYALLSAFFVATTDPIAKKILAKNGDEYIIGWAIVFLSTPFLAWPCFAHGPVSLNWGLIKTLLAVLPFEVLAALLYYKALKLTDISLSVPFLALTPVFSVLTAFLLLGEKTKPLGGAGIILITVGVYSLNLKEVRHGFTSPFKAIFANKGSFYMVIVAFIYSITSVVSKKAMLYSTPESIPFIYNLTISLGMLPVILYRLKTRPRVISVEIKYDMWPAYIALGFMAALSSIFYFKSIESANVAYAISIKRLSLLMSVGYGWLFFKERDIHIRLFSTFCMFLGVLLIILFQ